MYFAYTALSVLLATSLLLVRVLLRPARTHS
jgi:hypothetical protein